MRSRTVLAIVTVAAVTPSVMKVAGIIDLSWWLILAPVWLSLALVLTLLLFRGRDWYNG